VDTKDTKDIKAPSPAAAAMWQRVATDWDNPKAHDVFLGYCARERVLDYAARQYAAILKSRPDDMVAVKARDRIVNLAVASLEQQMVATTSKRREKPNSRRWGHAVTGILAGLLALAVAYGLSKLSLP